MKKKMLNNLGVKILSIVCAIILWIVVMNVSDSRVTARIDDIPVEIINAEALEQLDKVYDVQKGSTVDLVVKGKRSVVEKLSAKDFRATADLSQMSITNSVQIMVEPIRVSTGDEISITVVDNTMVLSLEEKVKKQFPLRITTIGTPKDGCAIGEIVTTPNIITVEGPESSVNKIVEIAGEVNVDNISADVVKKCEISAYDAYGEAVVNERIKLSQTSVDTTIKIYPSKSVPVNINVKGNPGTGYEIESINYEPKEIMIAAPEDILATVKSIEINNISVSGLTENYETTIDIGDYIPKGSIVAQSDTKLVLSVVIEKQVEKTIALTNKDIQLRNTDTSHNYELVLSSDFELIASGLEDKMEGITLSDFTPYIDCKDMKTGDNYNVYIVLKQKDGVTTKINGTATLTITEK